MSILSVAKNRLLKGDDPAKVWTDTKTQIEAWGSAMLAKVPASVQPVVKTLVADVKQGASDLVGATGDALPAILAAGTPLIDDMFAKAATAYLGPTVGPALSAAEVDGLNRIEAWLIAQVKSAKLTQMAAATGVSAAPAPAASSVTGQSGAAVPVTPAPAPAA